MLKMFTELCKRPSLFSGPVVTADLACREKWLAQAIFHGSTVKMAWNLADYICHCMVTLGIFFPLSDTKWWVFAVGSETAWSGVDVLLLVTRLLSRGGGSIPFKSFGHCCACILYNTQAAATWRLWVTLSMKIWNSYSITNTKSSLPAALLQTTLKSKNIMKQDVLRPYHATFTEYHQL